MKPLGRKAYGSIPHLPTSRLGPTDSCITEGQARILTEKARDRHDVIIVQEKLDGSCCAIAKMKGEILALTRAGYLAETSPFKMHHVFSDWVKEVAREYKELLNDGERICGEWMYQAHGTIYKDVPPFYIFDLINENNQRACFDVLCDRLGRISRYMTYGGAALPHVLNLGPPMSVENALSLMGTDGFFGADLSEGVVWRVERKGKVDFLAKYVRHEKQDGIYLKGDPVYNELNVPC